MELLDIINVEYEYTSNLTQAKQWLDEIQDTVACDFEVAVKYRKKHLVEIKEQLEKIQDQEIYFQESVKLKSKLNATGLSHPCHCYITHFSFAQAEDKGKVIIINNQDMARLVLSWLVTTSVKQIWHNASFDFKHIYYHTKKYPKNYEDSQIATKCLLNHVETYKAKTGLKELMGRFYGQWSVTADYFTREQIYKEDLLQYAATDACATYKLWEELEKHVAIQ